MVAVAKQALSGISIDTFRVFYQDRPDEERWELIDGAAMMTAPATPVHQRIASNLERRLNDALEAKRPNWAAYQRVGVDLRPETDRYDPEPDVVVADVVETVDQRYVDRFYLAAEVVSVSDGSRVELKREMYRLHPHCLCVLTIRQDRHEVLVDLRAESGWNDSLLRDPKDVLILDVFGLRCMVGDLYRGTPLQSKQN